MSLLFRAHPWHGVPLGERAPEQVTCYIEITTADTVKYELDKATGLLTLDRPQRYSNVCPTLYGLLPQTYCGERVAQLSA
jgi:inorganic pyrophosphatase